MPNVRGSGQVPRRGYHNNGDINKTMKPALPRDDINEAYAGEENKGPIGNEKEKDLHSTKKKARKMNDPTRTPLR